MFFVMVEISNYRQLSRLRETEAVDLRDLLEHFCQNRGGKLSREQSGFFLFSFHPLREKVFEQVSDFLFLTYEALQKKKEDLFGFSLLLENDDQNDDAIVFNRLKALIFLAPRECRVWAGPGVLAQLGDRFPLLAGDPLTELLGPPQKASLSPLSVDLLLEMTGWIEALKAPLARQLGDSGTKTGKILRLKGTHLNEKFFVLKSVLHQLYGTQEGFPVLFPVENSRDFLSQLLARVDLSAVSRGNKAPEAAWEALLNRGGDYPGDSGRDDAIGALGYYFRTLIHQLQARGLPAVFVFLVPQSYEPGAQYVLDAILGELVAHQGLRLLLLEPQDKGADFLGRSPSLSWTFPPLVWERTIRDRDSRGWQDRFPQLSKETLDGCEGRGLSWVHHLWSVQLGSGTPPLPRLVDPSQSLFESLDSSHHKVYYVLWAGKGLLEESQLVEFFEGWGDDASVIGDKVKSLVAMGFFLGGVPRTLRPDFGPWLTQKLGEGGRELLKALGEFLYKKWKAHHRLSEVLFSHLGEWGLPGPSADVLSHYLNNKVNQGQGDFLRVLRPRLWLTAPTPDWAERLRLMAAAAKLRYALNLNRPSSANLSLDRFRRYFTPRTELYTHGEWLLQHGRSLLRSGHLAEGFTLLKKALLEAQQRSDKALEVRAQTEIGLALLRKNRLEEGREYFEISSRLAEQTGSTYLVTLTSALDAVALFLLGNLTGCLASIARGAVAADQGGLRKWTVFLGFVKARLEFDQGDYTAVGTTLENAQMVAQRYHYPEALGVLTAWKARAEAHLGNSRGARASLLSLPASAERGLFLAETAYHDGDWAQALSDLVEARSHLSVTQPFGLGENIAWSSGFAGIEDRALAHPGDMGVLENQIDGFQLLIEGITGDAEASQKFQVVLARKVLLDLDPVSAQFFFWHYLVLPKNDLKQEAQRLTLLGRSLKDVQVRSSRIEDPGHRQDYLAKPYWNAQFSREARKLKLL